MEGFPLVVPDALHSLPHIAKNCLRTLAGPEFLYPAVGFGIFQVGLFWLVNRYYFSPSSTEKQKAWALTILGAGALFLSSLVYNFEWIVYHDFDLEVISGSPERDGLLAKYTLIFFFTYLLNDLFLGKLYYPTQLFLLTSWYSSFIIHPF